MTSDKIIASLLSAEAQYPLGLPSRTGAVETAERSPYVLCLYDAKDANGREDEQMLLRLLGKGLLLSPDQYQMLDIRDERVDAAAKTARLVILLGCEHRLFDAPRSQRGLYQVGSQSLIQGFTGVEIRGDAEVKRSFWEAVKRGYAHIGR
ncbi:MAG: hypothetical protein QY326_06970 [Bdellovibrionota bacterium]|nr:MAG: hypothetical protein QY326_06970 [Bdellovibrionota bacterium]